MIRDLLDSLFAVSYKLKNPIFLSIPTDTLLPGHIDVVKETFSKYKVAKEPSTYVEHGKAAPDQEYLFVTFADNFHKAHSLKNPLWNGIMNELKPQDRNLFLNWMLLY